MHCKVVRVVAQVSEIMPFPALGLPLAASGMSCIYCWLFCVLLFFLPLVPGFYGVFVVCYLLSGCFCVLLVLALVSLGLLFALDLVVWDWSELEIHDHPPFSCIFVSRYLFIHHVFSVIY